MGKRAIAKGFDPKALYLFTEDKHNPHLDVLVDHIQAHNTARPLYSIGPYKTFLPSFNSLKKAPNDGGLAIHCTPNLPSEQDLALMAEKGIHSALYLAPFAPSALPKDIVEAYLRHNIHVFGPNSLGLIAPNKNLNISLNPYPLKKGKIAFVSQSNALAATVLDWASAHDIGFSHFVSLGHTQDVGLDDMIDYLGSDPYTRAIILCMESIQHKRHFMSAARAAARNKPIIVLKTGNHQESSHAVQTHTGAMTTSDMVYNCAFRRAGMLRVDTIAELFAAAETLAMTKPFKGKRLAIASNGGGLGILALDHLLEQGGQLAQISEDTRKALESRFPDAYFQRFPLSLGDSARPQDYADLYTILRKDRGIDCTIILHTPTFHTPCDVFAVALADSYQKNKGGLIACWTGEQNGAKARKILEQATIPAYHSPRMAIMAFIHMVRYLENQHLLMQTPQRVPNAVRPEREPVRAIIDQAISDQRQWLKENEVKAILAAYGIQTVTSHIAANLEDAGSLARQIGFPVALKIMSPDLVHKSDIGGVALNLRDEPEVEKAADSMLKRLKEKHPTAQVDGFILQKMMVMPHHHEVIAGMSHDDIFGPVLLFGQGGTATEIIGDHAVALPPLNMALADDLIQQTRISALFGGYRGTPALAREKLAQLLVELSELTIDFPEIQEMEINPIFLTPNDAIAVDARIRVKPITHSFPNRRLAIRPYPAELEEYFTLRNGQETFIRPIRPEDEPAHMAFMKKVSPEDIRFRFFGTVRELPHSEMARLTQIDYDREMAFIAVTDNSPNAETLGVVRTSTDPFNEHAEYAILVRSDLKGQKLGWKLLNKMIDYCRSRGTHYFCGQILKENRTMISMVKALGFQVTPVIDDDIVDVKLKL